MNALGAGGYGPVHSPYHRIWHSPRNCRWAVTVLDVPASNSRASVAEVSQHGQRSVVSVPPMAGQPSSVEGDGNQDRTLRAAFASLCGAACWNPKERVPGSNIILDNRSRRDKGTATRRAPTESVGPILCLGFSVRPERYLPERDSTTQRSRTELAVSHFLRL